LAHYKALFYSCFSYIELLILCDQDNQEVTVDKRIITLVAATAIYVCGVSSVYAARDYISIVGSSTVYLFATVVAEQFGRTTKFRTPKVESTGSGGGLNLFCGGVGVEHPDVTNASRRIKKSEVEKCHKNGVTEIVEVKIGYGGIVLANSKRAKVMQLSRKDIFLALAKDVPDPSGAERLVPNPHKTWKDVNPKLPDRNIEVLGPPPTSGTRDAFVELAMEGGCKKFDWIKANKKKDKQHYKAICHSIREDGAFIEAGENDNLIVQKLKVNPNALGVFGFSFLDNNIDMLQGSIVDGIKPTFENIASQDYPVSRPLYFYVKTVHIGKVPGIQEYVAEFTSEKAWGPDGYLSDRGLIPMLDHERHNVHASAESLENLQM